MSDLDGLRARFERLINELSEQANSDGQDDMAAAKEAKRAQDARQGKLGPDWQTVQRRIDRNETTLADVFSGADTTPAAARLRELSRKNLTAMRESWQDDEQASGRKKDEDQNPTAAATRAREESHARFEALTKEVAERLRRG
jgi:hypothetical protein